MAIIAGALLLIVGLALVGAVVQELRSYAGGKRVHVVGSGHAQMLPWREPVKPWAYKLASGAYLAALLIDANDGDEQNGEALGRTDAQLSKAVRELTQDCVAWFRTRYVAEKGYDRPADGSYFHPVAQFLDEQRERVFDGRSTFRSRRVMWVAWMPPSERAEAVKRLAIQGGPSEEAGVDREEQKLAAFDKKLKAIEGFFRSGGATVTRIANERFIDGDGIERERSVLASELAWCATHERRRFRLPEAAQQDGAGLVAAESFRGGYDLKVGRREFAIVVVKAFPDGLWPRKLKSLKKLGVEYEVVIRYVPLSDQDTLQQVNDARAEWLLNEGSEAGGDDYAKKRAAQASAIKGQVRQGNVAFGNANVYIVLSSLSRAAVDAAAQRAVERLEKLELRAFVASMTAEADYLAGLPGITGFAVRKFPLHSLNIVHLFNPHAESGGRRYNDAPTVPPRTPALTQAVTDTNEIVRVHWNHDPLDVMDHARVGMKGQGKSVHIAHEGVQFVARMPFAGVTLFDKGRSAYRVTRFLQKVRREGDTSFGGSTFMDLLKPGADAPGLALYRDIDDPRDYATLYSILHSMVEGWGVPMTGQRDKQLDKALALIKAEPPEIRSHSLMCEILQDQDSSMKTALERFTRENGAIGRTLDCEEDGFELSRWNVVEMQRLLDSDLPAAYVVPILAAIYWKSRQQVRRLKENLGRYDLYWLYEQDEAHAILQNEQGCKFIKSLLLEARREQLVLGLSSQHMAHFVKSPVWNDIKGEIQTWYYYPNPLLLQEEKKDSTSSEMTLREMYAATGLPARGINMVGRAPLHQPVYKTVTRELKRVRFEFDDATLAIIGRTRGTDNQRVDEFIARYGEANWRYELLKYEGVDQKSIERLMTIYERYNEDGTMSAAIA